MFSLVKAHKSPEQSHLETRPSLGLLGLKTRITTAPTSPRCRELNGTEKVELLGREWTGGDGGVCATLFTSDVSVS